VQVGGDEFAILIENCTDPFDVARMVSGSIQMSLKSSMDVGGNMIELEG
jgi:GGDEF domain-containing protein